MSAATIRSQYEMGEISWNEARDLLAFQNPLFPSSWPDAVMSSWLDDLTPAPGSTGFVGSAAITGPTVPTVPTGGSINMPPILDETFGPYTQYLARLGIGATGGGPAGGYQRRLYDPLRTLYGLEQTFSPITGATPGLWGDYLGGNYAGDPRSMYGRAGQILASLYNAGQPAREEKGLTFGPEFEGEEAVRGIPRGTQQALLYQALAPKLGYMGAQRLASRLPTEEDIWLQKTAQAKAATTTAQPPSGFFDYLVRKYGLTRFF